MNYQIVFQNKINEICDLYSPNFPYPMYTHLCSLAMDLKMPFSITDYTKLVLTKTK